MTSINSVHLEVSDPTAVDAFYRDAFGLGDPVRLRASEAASTGFRGFTLSLVVSQPATVDAFVRAALDAGATSLKPAVKQFWGGYSGSYKHRTERSGRSRRNRRRTPARPRGRSTGSCSCSASRTCARAVTSTSTAA